MELSWLTLVLIALVLLLVTYVVYMSSTHGTFKKMGIPGPRPWPVVGNFLQQSTKGMIDFQVEMYNRFRGEKVFGQYDSRQPIMVIRDLDMIKDITIKNFNSFVNRRRFEIGEPFDHAMTMIRDDHWKNVRSTVSPTFSTGKLKRMYKLIEINAKRLVENVKEKQERNEELELKYVLSCYTMDVIASTGFGAELNSLKDSESNFEKQAKAIMNGVGRFIIVNIMFPFLNPLFRMLGIGGFQQDALNFFKKFVDVTVENRKHESKESKQRHDFIQLMMESNQGEVDENDNLSKEEEKALKTHGGKTGMSYLDIQGQALIFILAGYDTVSTAMSFTLYLLALNPDCCKKAQEEIDEKLEGKFPTYDAVQTLNYLDMCINEAMRLFPPGFIIDRVCNEDVELHGVHIPKGMVVQFPVYSIHRDPEYWPEPEKFDPERFTPENKASRHPYAHLPFGQGPRNCIGMRLALLEMKVGLAAILQTMTPVKTPKSQYPVKLRLFQMQAQDGIYVKMEARKQRV